MITVRFPSGVAVTYNNVRFIKSGTHYDYLYSEDPAKDGTWIASIAHSGGAILEWDKPCAVVAPPVATVGDALKLVLGELNSRGGITGWGEVRLLADLKSKLQRFDARRKVWK